MFKQYVTTILTAALLASAATAYAEAPTSQFGFTGWPYRQNSCTTPIPTQEPAAPTCVPTDAPSVEPTPTQAPPSAPVITTVPTVKPTVQPTAAPTLQPTLRPAATPVPTRTPSPDDDYTTDSIHTQEQIAHNLLNQDRKANGMASLPLDAELSRIARIKSEDMRNNGYFAHESPTYGSVRDMLRRFGYSFTAAGENIAHHATVHKAQAAFMSSAGHRQNILSASWTKVGIGVCYDKNGYVYVTQIFAR